MAVKVELVAVSMPPLPIRICCVDMFPTRVTVSPLPKVRVPLSVSVTPYCSVTGRPAATVSVAPDDTVKAFGKM